MKKHIYLSIMVLMSSSAINCNNSQSKIRQPGQQGAVISPVHRNQTVQLKGRNMGSVQSIDLSVVLPYDSTSGLKNYEGFINIHGRIQLDSSFKCLGGNHATFNCEAEVINQVIEISQSNIRGNTFQIRVPIIVRNTNGIYRDDILSVEIKSLECLIKPYRAGYC